MEDENRPTIQLGKKSYTLSKLANRVADLLDGRPVTYLSDHLGVTVEKIIETLSENKKIEDYLLHNIAEALGVNKDNLYERSNSKNVKENNKTYKTNPQSISNETLLLIQQWLDEAEQLRPGQKIWFQIEFENRFPEYSHWLEKKRAGNDH